MVPVYERRGAGPYSFLALVSKEVDSKPAPSKNQRPRVRHPKSSSYQSCRPPAKPDEGYVFLSSAGRQLAPNYLSWLVRRYVQAAEPGKSGACHIFRHTMATLMLEGGADVRYIQAMLGHARLDTTQIYTHVSIRMLKQIHAATHPAARLNPTTNGANQTEPRPSRNDETFAIGFTTGSGTETD